MDFQKFRLTAFALIALGFIASCGQQSETKNDTADTETSSESATNSEEATAGEVVEESSAADEAQSEPAVKAKAEKPPAAKKPAVKKPAEPPKPKTQTVAIPAGMNVVIALTETIETGQINTGDAFSGTLVDAIVIDGKTVFAAGTEVTGTVLNAVGSGRLKTDAEISLTLQSIANTEIQTDVIEDKASSHKDRNKKLIGGGALIGGVLGALKGKNLKGALTGAAAGAAAGTGAAALTGKKNLKYEAGSLLQFTLAETVKATIPK